MTQVLGLDTQSFTDDTATGPHPLDETLSPFRVTQVLGLDTQSFPDDTGPWTRHAVLPG